MGTRKDDWLRLEVADIHNNVDVEAFLEVFQNTLSILKELNKSVSEFGQETLDWRITEIGCGSPVFAKVQGISNTSQNGDYGPRVVSTFIDGLLQLDTSDDCPPFFTDTALSYARKIVDSHARGISRVTYQTRSRTAIANKNVAKNAAIAIRKLQHERGKLPNKYVEFGSIEGKLTALSESKHRDKIQIIDSLTGESVNCYFTGNTLDEVARKAWKHRVSVHGKLHIDRSTGNPKSVQVESIDILRDRADLPQLEDITGIDITGGRESSEYIGDLRDAR